MKKKIMVNILALSFFMAVVGTANAGPPPVPVGSTADATSVAGAEANSKLVDASKTYNNPSASAGVSANISPIIDAGSQASTSVGDINPETRSSVEIVDNSVNVNKSKFYNRQIPMVGIMGSPDMMQSFSPLRKGPAWNESLPSIGVTWTSTGKILEETPYRDIVKRIYVTYPRSKSVTLVDYEKGVTHGQFMGHMSVRVNPDQGTGDAELIVLTEAFKIGASVIEVLTSSVYEEPISEGWHVGFGAGAGGVVGADEKGVVSGAGGTGFGESKLGKDTSPYMVVKFWRNGNTQSVSSTPISTNEVEETDPLRKQQKEWHMVR